MERLLTISEAKRKKIAQLIVDHHLALTADVLGEDAIDPFERARLIRQGTLKRNDVDHSKVAVQAAHTVGKMGAAAISNTKLGRMSPEKFWAFVETAPPQFSANELAAIKASQTVVGRAITNLGAAAITAFETAAHEEETKQRHLAALQTVQHEIALGIARGSTKAQIIRRLEKKIDDASRDWALVVTTELHNAKEYGKALNLTGGQGRDPLVYKETQPNACRFCIKLYRNGNRPRLFKLSTLVKNGTNVGKKHSEMRPVIGATHPACQCELMEMPEGFTFDDEGKLIQSFRKALPDDLSEDLQALIGHRCV